MMEQREQDLQAVSVEGFACPKCGHDVDVRSLAPFTEIECPACRAPCRVPVLLGSFLLTEKLGQGGMGAVYRGRDATLHREVAIKVMRASLGRDPGLMEHFLREARAAAAINHPNIVQIYSCGKEQGQPYIVMELVSANRLDRMIRKETPIPEERVLEIALDVARGLAAAHEAGLVHGDLKPENILIDRHGTAKIADFGLAQFVKAGQEKGEIWGTPYYISPERARGGALDQRSDLYSLGATVFHALAGQPPFEAPTAGEVVLARLKQPTPDPRTARSDLHRETAAVVMRMMAVDPLLRYPTSASLIADITSALKSVRSQTDGASPSRKAAVKRMAWVVAAGVAMLVVLGAWWWLAREKEAPPAVSTPEPANVETAPAVVDTSGAVATPPRALFEPEMEARLISAADHLARGELGDADGEYRALAEIITEGSARALWVPVFRSIPAWLRGDDQKALSMLGMVSRQSIPVDDAHRARMPVVLAGQLLGEEVGGEEIQAAWPAWYPVLGDIFQGVLLLRKGDLSRADLALQRAHAGLLGDAPGWVLAYRGLIERLRSELDQFRTVQVQVGSWLVQRNPDEASRWLEAFAAAHGPVWGGVLQAEQAAVQATRETLAAEARERKEVRRLRTTVEEFEAYEELLREQSDRLLIRHDYAEVRAAWAAFQETVKSAPVRDAVALMLARLDRILSLQSLLPEATRSEPIGVVIQACEAMIRQWPDPEDPARADALLSLGVLCYMNGGRDAAVRYASLAVERNPGLAEVAKQLLPEVRLNEPEEPES